VLLPEAVLVEALPDGVFFDMEDELGIDILELDDIGLADGGDGVAAGAHFSAVDLVAVVDDGDVADHGAAFLGEDVEFFAERSEGDLEVFEDAVGFGLVVEGFFLGAFDGVEGLVEHPAEGECFVGVEQLVHGFGVEEGLHELACLAEVEELTGADGVAHLEDALFGVPVGVGSGADRDIHLGLGTGVDGIDDVLGEARELLGGIGITLGAGVGLGARGGGGFLGRLLLGDLLGGL